MIMNEKIVSVRLPKLYDAGGDLKRKWNVYYYVRDPQTGKMKRFQVWENLNQARTSKDRREIARKIIQRYKRKLMNGWRPWHDSGVIYEDVTTYAEPGKKFRGLAKESDFSIAQFLSEALLDHNPNIRKRTFQSYQSKVRKFMQWLIDEGLNEVDIKEFTNIEAQSFLNSLDLHSKTRKSYRETLKILFNLLIQKGIVRENPFNNTKLPPAQSSQGKRAFRRLEQKKIKNYCLEHDPELWFCIQFIFYCFIRPGELRFLKVSDVDLDSGKILLRPEISKNKKRQHVIIPEVFRLDLEKNLESLRSDDFIFPNKKGSNRAKRHFYIRHRAVLDVLGFGYDVSLYSWKHTGVVEFYRHTRDIKSLQEQLRHHSLDEVQIYLRSLGLMDNDLIKNSFPEL